MWIYSLGRTLMKTMPTIPPAGTSDHSMQQQQHHSSIVLQATIWKMCKSVEERASLMFLLNVSIHISTAMTAKLCEIFYQRRKKNTFQLQGKVDKTYKTSLFLIRQYSILIFLRSEVSTLLWENVRYALSQGYFHLSYSNVFKSTCELKRFNFMS